MGAKRAPGTQHVVKAPKKSKKEAQSVEDVFDVNLYTRGVEMLQYDVLRVDTQRRYGQVTVPPSLPCSALCCCCHVEYNEAKVTSVVHFFSSHC